MLSKLIRPRTLVLLILLLAVAAMTYGFAATLTVGGNNDIAAGSSNVMSDMEADVTWVLNSSTPDENPTAQVDFSTGNPSVVWAILLTTGGVETGSWVSCSDATTHFNCTFTATVESIYGIRIAAAE